MIAQSQEANPYLKPPSMSTSQSLKTFIYNRETGAFMGRTASSWGKLLLYSPHQEKGNVIYVGRSVPPCGVCPLFQRLEATVVSIGIHTYLYGDSILDLLSFVLRFLIYVITVDSRKVLAFLIVRISYLKAIKRNSE